MEICKNVYVFTQSFPKNETYGIVQQMRRAAVSVPSNIAEGSQRKGGSDFMQFLRIAKGSLAELETQLLLSIDLQFVSLNEAQALLNSIDELSSMIYSFQSKLSTAC